MRLFYENMNHFEMYQCLFILYESLVSLYIGDSNALGIAAASFAERSDSGASKDRAESPTAELEAEPERPKKGTKGMRI